MMQNILAFGKIRRFVCVKGVCVCVCVCLCLCVCVQNNKTELVITITELSYKCSTYICSSQSHMYARKLLLLQSVHYSQYITASTLQPVHYSQYTPSCVNEVASSCRIKVASSNNHIDCDVNILFL